MEKKLNGILLNFHHFLTPCLLIIWSVKKSIDIFTPNTFFHSWQLILTDTLVYLVPRKKIWKKHFSLFENTFVLSILRFRALSLPLFSQFPLVHRSFISFHSFIYIVLSLYTNLYAIKWMFVYAIFVRSLHMQSLNCNKKLFSLHKLRIFFFMEKEKLTAKNSLFVHLILFHFTWNKTKACTFSFFLVLWKRETHKQSKEMANHFTQLAHKRRNKKQSAYFLSCNFRFRFSVILCFSFFHVSYF